MHFFAAAATVSSLFALAAAENFTVIVGKDGGLTYDPPQLTAKVGDTVAFRFVSKNHTVTQSSFANPCTQLTTPALGVDSGYQPVAAGATAFPEWSITVDNDTAPLWFYCAQGAHCKAGMVFALNPTADKTYEAFLANAQGSGTTGAGSTGVPGAGGSTGTTGAGASSGAGAAAGTTGAAGAGASGSAPAASPSASTGAAAANGSIGRSASSALLVAVLGLVGGLLL